MIHPPGPTPKRPLSGGRHRPRAVWSRPPSARTPDGPTPARSGASTSGSTAASSTTWPSRRNLAELHDAGRASSSASMAVAAACFRAKLAGQPAPAGERSARVLAGYRRTAGDRGRGQTRPFGVSDLAAVLATCHRSRRRGRGVESDQSCRRAGTSRCGDRGTAVHGRDAAQRGQRAALGRRRRYDRRATGSSSPSAEAKRTRRVRSTTSAS